MEIDRRPQGAAPEGTVAFMKHTGNGTHVNLDATILGPNSASMLVARDGQPGNKEKTQSI